MDLVPLTDRTDKFDPTASSSRDTHSGAASGVRCMSHFSSTLSARCAENDSLDDAAEVRDATGGAQSPQSAYATMPRVRRHADVPSHADERED